MTLPTPLMLMLRAMLTEPTREMVARAAGQKLGPMLAHRPQRALNPVPTKE